MRLAGIAGVLLVLGAIVSGCSDDIEPAAEPTSAPPTAARTTSPSGQPDQSVKPLRAEELGGPGGMTIRYLDSDGKIKTIRVEDFPH
jgi:hypothetical protein